MNACHSADSIRTGEEINEDLHKDFEGESKTLAEGGALLYINLSQGLQLIFKPLRLEI